MLFAPVRNKNTESLSKGQIEIVYASVHNQKAVHIEFKPALRVIDAIRQSGLLEAFPEIDMTRNAVGIFGRKVSLNSLLSAGDRVEIYRPLKCSPQDARRRRAFKDI